MKGKVVLFLLSLSSSAFAQSVLIGTGSQEFLGAGSQVVVSPGDLTVQNGGFLTLAGTSPTSPGTLTSGVAAGTQVNVLSGGTIDFKFGNLENILSVVVSSQAKITRIHDTVFRDLAGFNPGAIAWINLSALLAVDRANLPFSFNRVTFQNTQGSPTRKSIQSGANTPLLRCLGNASHGNCWGGFFEQDTANVILWHTGQIARSNPPGAFDTVEDALKDTTTAAGSIITVNLGPTAFIDDVADFNTVPGAGASPSGPAVRNAALAPMTGKAVFDGDGDSTRRGKIVNTFVARGTIEETTAENCTFFDPGTAVVAVNNVAGTNCLIESGFTEMGNSLTTSLGTATPGFFAAPAAYNFHLVSPGGNDAIDQGTAGSPTEVDADGESRGADGKVGGLVGNWDIGADELILLQTPLITTTNNKKTNDSTPIITGTASPNVTITVYYGGIPDGTTTANAGGAWTYHNLSATKLDYSYSITANSSSGGVFSFTSSPITLVVDTVCNPPTNVTATPKNAIIDIEWSPSPDADVLGYRVWRSTTGPGGTYTLRSPAGQIVTGTKYRDSGLTNGTAYSYKVTAVDNAVNEKH